MQFQATTEEPISPDTMPASDTPKGTPFFWEYELALLVKAYGGVIIVIMGMIGNVLAIAVLAQKSMCSSTNIYLLNLSVADLGVMIIGQLGRVLPRAFTGFDTASYHPSVCKTWYFANHSFSTISGWTLVAVTIERTIVVYLPLRAKVLCTRQSAKWAILAINTLCTLIYLHYFWTLDAIYEQRGNVTVLVQGCSILRDHPQVGYYITTIRPWQDFLIRSVMPFFCISMGNIMIIIKLCNNYKTRKILSSNNAGCADTKMRSLTVMLLTINFAYLLCISPLQVMYLIDKSGPFVWKITERWQALVALRWAFAINVYYLNHAINFFLYCISGREFREAVKALFANRCCHQRGITKTEISSVTLMVE